jgi:CubicO group peptidase (beta-lactamase class C family)
LVQSNSTDTQFLENAKANTMIKYLLTLAAGLMIGGALAVFAYMQVVPLPNDAIARGAAFEAEDGEYLFQNASEVFPTRIVARAEAGHQFETDLGALDGFTFEYDGKARTLGDMFTDMETSGLIVLHKGELVYEQYGRGADAGTQFTTYSLVKSFTSTLIGFAVGDGLIASVEDPLTQYLPELAGTAYEGVTIRQAMEMSSGVEWDPGLFDGEDMTDTIGLFTDSAVTGKARAFDLAIKAKRIHEPGTTFNYNTGESQVLIELVRRVTGEDAADYMSDKLWKPLGMSHDAAWILDNPGASGAEIGGAFFNASLRDWARFGLFIEQGGVWQGEQLLPVGWVDQATVSDLAHLQPGEVHPSGRRGYAWQWWPYEDGTFAASGANGQTIYIDRVNDIVVARSSAWPEGWVRESDDQTWAMFKALPVGLNGRGESMFSGAAAEIAVD